MNKEIKDCRTCKFSERRIINDSMVYYVCDLIHMFKLPIMPSVYINKTVVYEDDLTKRKPIICEVWKEKEKENKNGDNS